MLRLFLLNFKTLLFFSFTLINLWGTSQCATINSSFNVNQTFYCGTGPYNLTFTNTTTGSLPGTTTFEWYQNGILFDNTNNAGQFSSQTITSIGSYDFMLIALDSGIPCEDTSFVTVTIAPNPNSSFNFGPNNNCAYNDVNFNNTSSGTSGATTYNWNFGDGATSTDQNPTHIYSSGGNYNATLTLNNGPGCSSTSSQTVNVTDAPTPSIAADDGDGNTVYCLFPGDNTTAETVTFSNFTTGGVSYDWDFGDGSPVVTTNSLADITHDYTSYGTFTVTMTATGLNGCQTPTTVVIVFEKFVSAALTLDITEYSGCAPHPMSTLSNLSINATNYIWDFGDGTVINTNSLTPPNYSYPTSGSYTITLTASNSCNTAIATISPIIIIDGPTGNFNSSVTNGCAPQTVTLNNTSTDAQPANNFQWDMGNGNTYTNVVTPPSQTYDTTGTYTIEMIAGNACGNDTIIKTIFIDTIPTVDLFLDPTTGCSPLNVDPTTTLLTGINVNWQWYVDGIYTSNSPNDITNQNFLSLNPNDSTLHTIQVNVSNICGNDFDLDSVYVNPPVISDFTTLDTICFGTSSNFTNLSTGTELIYAWDFGDGSPIVNDTTPTYTYPASGSYTATLTTIGICGTDISTFVIDVLPIPIIDILPNPINLCSGESVSFTNNSSTDGSYYWDFGANGSITNSTLFNPGAITFTGLGIQAISFAIDFAGCINSDTAYINVNPIPLPDFTITPPTGCTPLDVAFTNNTANTLGNVYNWDYGNGNSSTGITPLNQNYLSGVSDSIYTVQLIVQTAAGCIDSITQTVTVHPLPIADFNILEDTICLGTSMLFANNSINSTTYEWNFGDGTTSTLTSPGYTYLTNGNFQITLIAYTAFGCTDTIHTDVYVDSIPTASFINSTECFGSTTTFTNTSTGSPVSYSWDFGDGSSLDNTLSPTHLYGASGSYLVTLTVTNSVDCSNSLPQIVQVNDVPIADLNWSQTCEGQLMNFTDASLNSPIGWAWDFGDGSTISNLENPSHLYADTGYYNVHFIVSGGSGCLDSIDYIVYIDSIPTAAFTFTEACATDQTFLVDNSTFSPDNYSWTFGDGNSSSINNPTNIYTNAGTYPVTLTVSYTTTSCSNSVTQNVEAFPRTVPAFTANTPCLGETTSFSDQTTNTPTTWEWNYGDGSPAEFIQNPTHLFATQGLFTVTLITSNTFGCSDTLIQQIEIYGLPTADFTFNTVCEGANTIFTNNSFDDVSWQWDFGDGMSSLNENPVHVFTTNGVFTTELVVLNIVGCSDTTTHSITVNPNPVAGFYADTACFSYQTSFIDTSTMTTNWSYDFGDLIHSNLSNPTHIYPTDNNYTVQQVVTNVFGCMDSTTQNILVYPQPIAGFTNNIVCALDAVDLTDTSNGVITYWEWDFGDGSATSFSQNTSNTYQTGGFYDVTLISGNGNGCLDTTIVNIEVYTNPIPNFEADTVCYLNITHFTDLSNDIVPIITWDYDFGDNINQSTLQNPTYIYQSPGIYSVSMTATNIYGCDSDTIIDVIVNNIPVAEFDYDTVCWGSSTNFNDLSTGSVNSWNWDFGNGTTSTVGPNISYTYPNPGSYIVSLEVDGGSSCTDIIYHAITVIEVVTPAISAQDTACMNTPIVFQDISSTNNGVITGWLWNFGDGTTSTLQNPTHSYLTPGIYNVTLDVQTSTGCTSTGTYVVTVFDPPTPQFDFTIPCEGQPTLFTDNSSDNNGAITSWNWDFGNGSPFSTIESPNHQYAAAGNYPVTLTVGSSNGCFNTLTQTVTIHPSPTADFISGLECGGVPVDLVSTSTGNITTYEWIYDGNSISSTAATLYQFPSDTDTHPVTLIVTTDLGCIDSITQNMITRPVVLFDYGPFETAGCPVMEVEFFENSITTSGGEIINWLWDMGDGTNSFQQNPIHFYEDEGTYTVTLQVITTEDCIYLDTLTYSIIVYPQPIADFTYSPIEINILNPEVEFTNNSIGAQDVEWDFGDYDYSNNWNPTHLYTDTGYFEVTQIVYNQYGCSDTISKYLHVNGTFVVYIPNSFTPNSSGLNDLFHVEGYGIQSFELLIFNRWGNLIKTITNLNEGWDGTYNGKECMNDIYTWKLSAIDNNNIEHARVGHVTLIR